MGKHLNELLEFQSDKYPELPPDKIILSFKDPAAIEALRVFAVQTRDTELADDIVSRLDDVEAQMCW